MPAEKEKKPFKDVRTKRRIHEHLSNKNDRISEEDISNVKTDFVEEDKTGSNDDSAKGKLTGVEEKDTSQDPDIETPWNILK